MRIDVYVHLEDHSTARMIGEVLGRIDLLQEAITEVSNKENQIMATLDETLAAVTDESTKEDSLIALVEGIKAQLDAVLAGALPANVQAKVDQLFSNVTANSTKVQAAIDANTPAAPTP